jgi:putative membrane protein
VGGKSSTGKVRIHPSGRKVNQVNESKSGNESDYPQENLVLAKRLYVVAWILTVVVLALVGLMRQFKFDTNFDFSFLPPIHATINAIVAVLLVSALAQIKTGNVKAHQSAISAAMLGSILFLVCYVTYHFTTPETKYGGEGTMRTVYFVLLISHIVLAAISFPLILFTWIFGYTGQVAKHRKFARFTFPMWLYVAVTGPICYWMLRPYY